uniref:Peptidase S9A N-terminal domain-containing protein n=1 Tax=Kalanchoe fedtschenkoi TaxID=63787 RepID=A0A7N0ZVI3_KALFE
MHNLIAPFRHRPRLLPFYELTRSVHRRAPKQPPPPPRPPPSPPKPPQKPETFTLHDTTWEDPYSWMSKLNDKVAMRHMDVYMEQEEKYTEAVMSDTDRLQSKLQSEMASRMAADLSTPPLRWGPWLYYRRVEEGKPYCVLCRRLAALNEEFMSYKSPSAGFDFRSGRKIEQKLVDYNVEADRFGGYAYEDQSEISPNHRYFAYLMYDRDKDFFKLSVRDLNSGVLFNKPQAEQVCNIAWAKDGQVLLYVVTDSNKRPYRMYCSTIGSSEEDVLLFDAPDNTAFLKIRHTKDFRFVTVKYYCAKWSKVYLMNAADPLSGMAIVWEGEPHVHCVLEHHQGYLYLFTNASREGKPVDHHYILRKPLEATSDISNWEPAFAEYQGLTLQDVDFCDSHMVLTTREGRSIKLCAVELPLPDGKHMFHLKELNHHFLPLPTYVSHIYPGPNYDYYSGTMRFTVSTPVMPDAVVDYELSSGKWTIIQQKNMIRERKKILYGKSTILSHAESIDETGSWNDLLEYYACEQYDVLSSDGAIVPLTVTYSRKHRTNNGSPGLVHVHGAYGEVLDKRWRSEFKSLLDRGWVVAYADVRFVFGDES